MDSLEIMTKGMNANLKEFAKRVLELGEEIFTNEPADHKGPFYEMRHIFLAEKTGPFRFSSKGSHLVVEAITDFLDQNDQNAEDGATKLFWIRNFRMSRRYLSFLESLSLNLWNKDFGSYLSYLPFLDRDEEIDSILLPEFGIVRFIEDELAPGRGHEVKGFRPLFNPETLRVEEEEIKSFSYEDIYFFHFPGFPGFHSEILDFSYEF